MMIGIDTEWRELMDKVTEYSKVSALCGNEKEDMCTISQEIQESCLKIRNDYAKHLHDLIKERDIDEEKLRSGSGLTIELSKFKGYDSKLDIFTFRSEFFIKLP